MGRLAGHSTAQAGDIRDLRDQARRPRRTLRVRAGRRLLGLSAARYEADATRYGILLPFRGCGPGDGDDSDGGKTGRS